MPSRRPTFCARRGSRAIWSEGARLGSGIRFEHQILCRCVFFGSYGEFMCLSSRFLQKNRSSDTTRGLTEFCQQASSSRLGPKSLFHVVEIPLMGKRLEMAQLVGHPCLNPAFAGAIRRRPRTFHMFQSLVLQQEET